MIQLILMSLLHDETLTAKCEKLQNCLQTCSEMGRMQTRREEGEEEGGGSLRYEKAWKRRKEQQEAGRGVSP